MMGFRQFILAEDQINERKYPRWLRFSVAGIVIKIRGLQSKIDKENDPNEQNKLIAKQNALLSYIGGLSIGVGSTDKILLQKLRRSNFAAKM